jgi:hypothetical protein
MNNKRKMKKKKESRAPVQSLITKQCNRSLEKDPSTFNNLINYKESSASKCNRAVGYWGGN